MWCLTWVLGTSYLRVLRLRTDEVCCKHTGHHAEVNSGGGSVPLGKEELGFGPKRFFSKIMQILAKMDVYQRRSRGKLSQLHFLCCFLQIICTELFVSEKKKRFRLFL